MRSRVYCESLVVDRTRLGVAGGCSVGIASLETLYISCGGRRRVSSAVFLPDSFRVEDEEGWEWNSLNVFDSAVSRPESDQFQIALFPRVIIARDDEWGLVFPGAALWESQTAAADREWQKHKAAVVKAAKRPTPSGRRMSRVDGYGNAPESPTSPTNAPFLDRRKSEAGRGDG
jgi:hypothetical protein